MYLLYYFLLNNETNFGRYSITAFIARRNPANIDADITTVQLISANVSAVSIAEDSDINAPVKNVIAVDIRYSIIFDFMLINVRYIKVC